MAKTPSTPTTPAAPKRLKVRATRMGYYDHIRRREGDVFVFAHVEGTPLPSWVEQVDARTPERITTGAQELQRHHDEILASRTPGSTSELDVI